MKIQRCVLWMLAVLCFASCKSSPSEEELKRFDEQEIQRQFPALTVDCIPEVRMDSWAWLDDYNLIVWTHAQRRNPYWLQMQRRCIGMQLRTNLRFIDRERDRRICGAGGDAVVSLSGGIEQQCPIGSVRPLNDLELNQVLVFFGKDPLPVRLEWPEEETAPAAENEGAKDTESDETE